MGKFTFRDMVCENCHVAACFADGLPEQPIEDITVENIKFTYDPNAKPDFPSMKNNNVEMCRAGLYFDNVKKLTVRNIDISGNDGDVLITNNCGEIIKDI